jgi:hypothetical protein
MSAPAQALPGEQVHITTDPSTEPFWTAAQQDRHVAPKCDKGHDRHLTRLA